MNLEDLVNRTSVPVPWAEGEKIPWNDVAFSHRMLKEHLSQEHDLASRRGLVIDRHVDWIHSYILNKEPSPVLDLGCGPGLYTSRLARLGHTCVGVDFSPASIEYARQAAEKESLKCTYFQEDVRTAEFGAGHRLVMFLYGELNVFRPQEIRRLLEKATVVLQPGGFLLLEVHTFETILQLGSAPASWYSTPGGLFSERPHFCLQENSWCEEQSVATQRYFVVDAATSEVTRYASSMQAYTEDEYRSMLLECGFRDLEMFPSMENNRENTQEWLFILLAHK